MDNEDIVYVNGLKPKKPQKNRKDFDIGKASIHVPRLKEWLEEQNEEWLNIKMWVSKNGNPIAAIDTWRPANQEQQTEAPSEAQAPNPSPSEPEAEDDIPW